MKKILGCFAIYFFLFSCNNKKEVPEPLNDPTPEIKGTSIVILGTIQDAGSPQIACNKECCASLFEKPDANRQIISLGVVDAPANKTYLFDATPDIGRQMKKLTRFVNGAKKDIVDGIFLTHAHIGHYTGIMFLGKEAMDAPAIPVFAMPKMTRFIKENAPWSQLVQRENIALQVLNDESDVQLSKTVTVTPFLVPHRDEFSETVGYKIKGPNKTALFIPDIDKWEKWEKNIIEEIKQVDYAFLDATFYSGVEINNRDISEIPHPFIIESLEKFKNLSKTDKSKVIFIHFNHTNPVINPMSEATKSVENQGFSIARINNVYEL